MLNIDLKALKKVVPVKWRVQSVNKNKSTCNCVAYIDARQLFDILDEAVGPENWQSKFEFMDGKLFAGIGINIGNDGKTEWVWKYDTGTESNIEAEKGEVSDALKRAGVQWGVARFLYKMDIMVLKTSKYNDKDFPADDSGKILWDGDALTIYCNSKQSKNDEIEEKKKYYNEIWGAVKLDKENSAAFKNELNDLGGKFSDLTLETILMLREKYVWGIK